MVPPWVFWSFRMYLTLNNPSFHGELGVILAQWCGLTGPPTLRLGFKNKITGTAVQCQGTTAYSQGAFVLVLDLAGHPYKARELQLEQLPCRGHEDYNG